VLQTLAGKPGAAATALAALREAEAAAAQDVEKYDTTQTDLLANAGSKLLGILGKGSVQYAAASGVPTQGGNEIYDAATGISDSLLKGKQALQQQAQRRLAQLSGQRQEAQKSALAGLGAEQAAAMAPGQLESVVLSNKLNKLRLDTQTATESAKADPKHPISAQYRELYRMFTGSVDPNASAAQLEGLMDNAEKMHVLKQSAINRKDKSVDLPMPAEVVTQINNERKKQGREPIAQGMSRASYNQLLATEGVSSKMGILPISQRKEGQRLSNKQRECARKKMSKYAKQIVNNFCNQQK
jgi:hypothetical protein